MRFKFPWEKRGSDNQVITFRITRPSVRKDGQTQSNSGLRAIEEDASVPPAAGSTRNSQSNYYRAGSDMAQLILPPVAAIAGAVPLAGAPLQAAINGLLAILRIIDGNLQNKEDLTSLESRLHELSSHLCNAPAAGDPGEQSLRDSLISKLLETSSVLENLHKRGIRSTANVAQAITGCSSRIDRYLLEYSVFGQMQIGHKLDAVLTAIGGTQLLRASTHGVTLVDATGHEHALLVEYCTSFQQLTMMLGVVFQSNSIEAQLQRQYLERGQYSLSIDHNTEVTQLTSDDWRSIEAGTKIVMSIVVKQQRERTESYQCYLCKTWNSVSSANQGRTCLIDCRGCGKRFQVSDTDGHDQEIQEGELKQNTETTAKDTKLIQNWHIQNEEVHDEVATGSPETYYVYKAKALYAYTASPDDPREISFTKGEILDIVDKQGKWCQAKKMDGTIGIAPTNYLQLI